MDEMTGFAGIRANAGGLLVLALGTFVFSQALVSPRYGVPMTDFSRDLVGAQAAIHGVIPYQQLGDLEEKVRDLQIPEGAEDFWVAHSPFSIGIARVVYHMAGDAADDVAGIAVTVGAIALVAWVLFGSGAGGVSPARMVFAGALAMSLGIESDIAWVQGASFLALLLAAVVHLCRSGKRALAIGLLGLAVAWRPWCAPIALFLSDRRSRDVIGTATVAALVTVVSTPFIGGFGALRSWVTEALPANTDAYLRSEWNVSFTGPYMGTWGALLLLGCLIVVLSIVKWRPAEDRKLRVGLLAVLGFFPIVWVHYWTALSLLTIGRSESDRLIAAVAYLCMAVPLVGRNPVASKLGAAAAFMILGTFVLVSRFEDGSTTLENRHSQVGSGRLPMRGTNVDHQ